MSTKAFFRLVFTVFPLIAFGCTKFESEFTSGSTTPSDVFWNDPSIIINEILFNPPPGGSDYIEIKNAGQIPLNVNALYLATMNADGSISKKYRLSEQSDVFFGGDYRVFTADKKWLCNYYSCDSNRVLTLKPMPVMSNSSGWIALVDQQNSILDQLQYTETMHFPFLSEYKGVALERVSDHLVSGWAGTWHSASFLSQFGTPNKINSQHRELEPSNRYGFSIRSKHLSPNFDGVDDLFWIDYAFAKPGIVAHLDVYKTDGNRVGKLWNGILLGTSGHYVWDGCIEEKRIEPGDYILFIKYFGLQGISSQAKIGVRVRW